MNKTSKFNDLVFILIIAFHLYNRQWPWGDTLQTVLDTVFIVTGVLIVAKYYILARK
ncbi:hypothetical protein HSX37_10655|uniref:hypothetical protein n=1 Tax=Dendrosporobacter quercicolus TaxID=146817 RepID=UPI00156DA403|nr:hypothetical protein [Dendrosporobacter quercicolus]NSL48491.1 hypothetical protein [Dendrosporobacter quercicolus DSM 1736]